MPDINEDASFPSLLTAASSSEDITQVAEEEIQKYEHRITNLKHYRNANVPISRLPPEMLCRVFHFASQDTSRGIFDWIKVSHVSRYWRDVAVNSPSLWTRPPLENARWTDEWLARSQMANLIVDVSYQNHEHTQVVSEIIACYMSRISHLKISWPIHNADSLLKILPKSAPTLESFVVDIHENPYHYRFQRHDISMPDNVLCEMGRLWCLELMGININWDLHLHNTLTTLKIGGITQNRLPTITQFWDALEKMPLLEILDLRDCLPVVEKVISRASETIKLPCLQELSFVSSVTQAETLLRNITFPPTTVIIANCRHEGSIDNSGFTGLFSLIARSTECGGKPIRIGEISIVPPVWLQFRAFATHLPCSVDWGVIDDKILEFSLTWYDKTCDMERVLGELFHELFLDEVVKLRIRDMGDDDRLSCRAILETYGILPKLQTLITELDENHLLALQEIIPPPNPADPLRSEAVSFPSLHSIVMSGTRFTDTPGLRCFITIDALLDCLRWRKEHGAEVHALMLDDCICIECQDIPLLRKVVVDVKWDGVERGFAYEYEEGEDEDEEEDNEEEHEDEDE